MVSRPQYGPQRKRHADHHDQRADVHRVADEAVQPGRHDGLFFLDGDGRGCVVVLDHYEFSESEPGENQDVACHDECRGHRRPVESVVQGAEDRRRHGRQHDTDIDELLHRSTLGERPALRAPPERIWELHGQVDGRDHGADDEHGDENPGLPVVECACGPEQQHSEEDNAEDCVPEQQKCSLHDSFNRQTASRRR